MSFDYSKLRGRIIELYGSQAHFADVFGISRQAFSYKMSNKLRFTINDIVRISEMLEISQYEIGIYFFTLKVKKN